MVDWKSPQTVSADYLALLKFIHAIDGLYIWEYAQTMEYEWALITGKKQWTWSIGLYLSCRVTTLAAVVTELVGFNLKEEFNCKGWLVVLLVFSYTAFALDSLLIVLRTIAIWERRGFIVVVCLTIWSVDLAFLLHGITKADATWNVLVGTCDILHTEKNRANVLVTLVTNFLLLIIMFFGIRRIRSDSSLWKLLYRHGILWITLAMLAELPPTVFLFLNLNDQMNLMFQTPALIVMTVGATRIYRRLHEHKKQIITTSYLSNGPLSTAVLTMDGKGTVSDTTKSSTTGASIGSLDVEFPTSYGRYRAEDLNPTLRVIEENEEDAVEEADPLKTGQAIELTVLSSRGERKP